MNSEVLGLSTGFDEAFIVKHMLEEVLGYPIPLDVYIESRTTFNWIYKHSLTSEKNLKIDDATLREAIAKGEVTTI